MGELSKINQKIISLAHRIDEIEDYECRGDFNTRESHIVANIKVYEWIGEDDVIKVIEERNLSQHQDDILEEFNENRLNSIYNHVCETEVSYLKEMYEDICHLDNYQLRASAYSLWIKDKYEDLGHLKVYKELYLKEWEKFSKRKKNSRKDYSKFLYKHHKAEIDEFNKLTSFERSCFQLGRSGGWFSICETNQLENCQFDFNYYFLLDNPTNKDINEYVFNEYNGTKRQYIREMENFISNWEEIYDNITYFIEEIETNKKGFKGSVIEELRFEIDQFMNDYGIVNVSISIEKDIVKTSLGVTVEKDEFTKAVNELCSNIDNIVGKYRIDKRVGRYFVEYTEKIDNDILIKAGCHNFSLNQIKAVLTI